LEHLIFIFLLYSSEEGFKKITVYLKVNNKKEIPLEFNNAKGNRIVFEMRKNYTCFIIKI